MTDPITPSPTTPTVPQEEPSTSPGPDYAPGSTPLESPVIDPSPSPGEWRPHD